MDRTDATEKNAVPTEERPALVAGILEAIGRLSARKREEGEDALKYSVLFNYIESKRVFKYRGFHKQPRARTKRIKVKRPAWPIGTLVNQGTASVYIDREGEGYLVTSYGPPRTESDITRMSDWSLAGKTYDQLVEIHALLARSHP